MKVLAFSWLAWCALHSLLISAAVVARARRVLGERFAWYRLGYVVFSTITLPPLLLYQYSLPQQLLWQWQGFWRLPQAALIIHAAVMALGGARSYNLHQLLGLDQIRLARQGLPVPQPKLRADGILRYIRHPWYSGGLAFLWAFGPFTDVSLLVRCILSCYLLLGAALEERKLLTEFGDAYRAYRARTPAFIPWRFFFPAQHTPAS